LFQQPYWHNNISIHFKKISKKYSFYFDNHLIGGKSKRFVHDNNAIQLQSIDPFDEDFSDLQPLKDLFADTRMILLGEQTHGDGSTFLAKIRLIKFLHQEMGFDILAIESGLYECNKAWQLIQTGEDANLTMREAVFPIWMDSDQFQPLVNYIKALKDSQTPLILAGFDNQFTGSISQEYLLNDLSAFLEEYELNAPDPQDWDNFSQILNYLLGKLHNTGQKLPEENKRDAFSATIQELVNQIEANLDLRDRQVMFWLQLLKSIDHQANWVWLYAAPEFDYQDPSILEMRDLQMGQNLIWLAEDYYSEDKIIVWAATFHNARNIEEVEVDDPELQPIYEQASVMGDLIWKALGDQMYSLGFTSYEGQTGINWQTPSALSVPSSSSLEDLMNRAGLQYAIIDMRGEVGGSEWLAEKMIARPFGHEENRANWTAVMDGVMFIREMEPSLPIGKSSINPKLEEMEKHQIRSMDGMEMLLVPAGTFQMGSSPSQISLAKELCVQYPDDYGKCAKEDFLTETNPRSVTLGSFWIDRTEITNSMYSGCVSAGVCRESRLANNPSYNQADYPVAGIPWQDADNYCKWVGGRLPTEAEWEYAARGNEQLIYPYGNEFNCLGGNLWDISSGCNDGYSEPAPVGSFQGGISWIGALDMSGNVWEWVSDYFADYPSEAEDNPVGPESGELRILRGGSWGYPPAFARTTYRYPAPASADYLGVGFRCVVPVNN